MERLVHELTRILAVIVTAPLWYPVVKALWKEANKALKRDGGVLGALPDARALREMEREERFEPPSMVSVPRDPRLAAVLEAQTRNAERTADAGTRRARGARPSGRPSSGPRRAGFR